jgi:predicted amino acid dehydrogenase
VKTIIDFSISSPHANFDIIYKFGGEKFRIMRLGCSFNSDLLLQLIDTFAPKADIVSLSGLPRTISIRSSSYSHPVIAEIHKRLVGKKVCDGVIFRDVYVPWSLKSYMTATSDLFSGASISFYTGLLQIELARFFEENLKAVHFADPYFMSGIPREINNIHSLENYFLRRQNSLLKKELVRFGTRDFSKPDLIESNKMRPFFESEIFVGSTPLFDALTLNNLSGKTVITDYPAAKTQSKILAAGAANIITCLPGIFAKEEFSFSIIEAILRSFKETDAPVDSDDILEWIDCYKLVPQVLTHPLNRKDSSGNFAFIIHPLAVEYYLMLPIFRHLRLIHRPLKKILSWIAPLLSGRYYGKITGIKSEYNSRVVEGRIYALLQTPKMLLAASPGKIYSRVLRLCREAKAEGLRLIGLGAYLKIVGDAGVTIAQMSPIPVTTGNSLSAAATLWAATWAIEKLNFVSKNEHGVYSGSAMIVGATGSIGKVCAKILSKNWKQLILVAPRPAKLLELKEEIQLISPDCHVVVCTHPDQHLSRCHLVITSTSAQGEKVLDIMKVRPGSVICDVSRPFDVTAEDARLRPDVLVISSGEVELPGDVHLSCDIGLKGTTVYACLAETAVLALEGRYECFTISRNLSYKKVSEIDALARKHGVKLAAVMGHDREIKPERIEACIREAHKKLSRAQQAP